ncbi:TadE/TadG family type IV pilus assembly protein [Streptomyces spirodelae]|uniref:Pilus assembly protein n=1 Tax=Streptomyces spirodelae TaxID=2812904 RepID=A0ABS3WPJ8_9ACTN|nr:TadE/TadG family type IV pilus assembly protein [Streptomyces spirodelae]MBO8184944.1 pilus assembly protein [Streptomyces spirodelae]
MTELVTSLRRSRRCGGDAGLSTIEVVILAPVMILFILVLVAFGQLVDGRGAVDSAARDAARAGSLQHGSHAAAMTAAQQAATATLKGTCAGNVTVRDAGSDYRSGGLFTVEVSCRVRGLGILGLDIAKDITGRSSSPIDPYRRTG